jgi:hypothetical protein
VSQSQTFLQISFGRNNYMSNTSTSADGEVGLPGWMFKNPLVVPSASAWSDMRNYAFANNKALTALVQIDTGVFSSAEWNWEKAESRCKRWDKCSVILQQLAGRARVFCLLPQALTRCTRSPSYKDGRTKAFYDNNLFNPCGRSTDNPCINNLVCAVTFDYCLLSMVVVRAPSPASAFSAMRCRPAHSSSQCSPTQKQTLGWWLLSATSPSRLPGRARMPTRDTAPGAKQSACRPSSPALKALLDALFSQNQMFSKFNALGLDNLLQSSLSGATDVTSDIENKLKS